MESIPIALIHRALEPFDCFFYIFLDTLSILETESINALTQMVSLVGGFFQPGHGFLKVYIHAVAFEQAMAEFGLAMDISLFGSLAEHGNGISGGPVGIGFVLST